LRAHATRALLAWVIAGLPAAVGAGDFGFDPDAGRLDLMSRYVWRGYERSDGWAVRPSLNVALWGRSITEDGPNGLDLQLEGHLGLQDRDLVKAHDQLAATLVFTHQLSDAVEVEEPYLKAGYTQYWLPGADDLMVTGGDAGARTHSEEVFAEARGLVRFGSQEDITLKPYVRAAYDFGRFDALYATVGVAHRLDPQKFPVVIDLDTALSLSNYPRAGEKSFGFHDWTSSAWVFYERKTLRIGPAAAVCVSSRDVSARNSVWFELRVGFVR
jgi:hypothetical protein